MKTGLVMEGGAMRGMFTAGVTDVMMENGVTFDGAVGVSAGAVFGCNYKSQQPGRVIRYNMKYCRDKRYASLHSLLTTGNLYGEQLCYHDIPDSLDPFDYKTYAASPMEFYVVCTDVNTGEAVYHNCASWEGDNILWMRASASMPLVSKIVEVGGYALLDGGIADSIPIRQAEKLGYDRNVIILTQPKGYVKQKNRSMPLVRMVMRKYPKLISAMEHRHEVYNQTIEYITRKEKEGAVYVIRPAAALSVGKVEKDPEKLRKCYETGRAACRIEEIKDFLGHI